ncbi:hypothetical protein GCM10028803_59870 [Larkinella knui]|uniref:Peptidase M48 domain-containing protein n=1 Tax=Larkinella knui TaxID=2025310 RepID=A0A3P1CAR6_9BACT|nr:tetratricopeptide repeat protein [Larkinella knui]RRB10330.1 hypothetical protein EHT87_29325 [Larkinella knui]
MGQSSLMSIVLLASLLFSGSPPKKPVDQTGRLLRVYARLLQTMGNPPDAPVLKLLPRRETGIDGHALYQPGNPARIELGDDVLTLCATFGPNAEVALACLLGHELAHFQYRHGSKQGFFSPVVMPTDAAYSSRNLEALADRSGIFMAYLAGYDAFSIAPAVYEAYYRTFKKPDQIPGYPTKNQRLRMVADTAARVQELAQLFEIGEISYLMRDYAASSRAFDALITRYPDVTTRNNLGASKLNQALARMPSAREAPRLRFAFPIEFDSDNRLLTLPRRDKPLRYEQLLTEAHYLFKTALDEQPTHQSARLNLAIAEYLLGNAEQARQTLGNAPLPKSANEQLMLGIVLADLGQNDEARKSFKMAVAKGAFRARENEAYFLKGLESGWLSWFDQVAARQNRKQEKPASLPAWPAQLAPARQLPVMVLPGGGQVARTDSLTSYEIPLALESATHDKPAVRIYRVLKSSRRALKGLPMGSSSGQLARYGPPTTTITGARGTVFYGFRKASRWLFLEYRDNRLTSWVAAEPKPS